MKLKTLKDLCSNDWADVRGDRLKQEAIKWIKSFRTMRSNTHPNLELNQYSWMDFFNLTEEDLK